jgi:outer membrane protein assembly factor BamD (BamD/ComL family)
MPDADRRQVSQRQRQQQKATLVDQLFGLVSAHEWFKAERLLISLEAEFPNDEDVTRGRSYLNHSRSLFESEAVAQAIKEIEELMLTASWDKALDRARQLMQGFPTSGDAHALLTRVEKEFQIYRETNVQRLFDDIRKDIDHRAWRPALAKAQQLVNLFPAHRFAEHMRGQMSTLQNNAEIEERQEIEIRIQEYLRDGKFEQAVDLGEDLMRRFPHSPQADSLETLLPKIRELARQGVSEFSGLSPELNPFMQGRPTSKPRQ